MATSMSLPDGGEAVAEVGCLLLVGVSVVDNRSSHWRKTSRPLDTNSSLKGVSYASLIVLRLQLALIYAWSGLSKLTVDDWKNGSAMFYIVRDPAFGASGLIGAIARWVTDHALGSALATWGTIVMEVLIALLILNRQRLRRWVLIPVLVLHVGIILLIGLWSFALIMIGFVVLATGPFSAERRQVAGAYESGFW